MNKYIWIFGENLGKTANDNSFYLWQYVVNIDDGIEKYFILEKNDSTLNIYNSLSNHEKKFILWKNSIKHFRKFADADLFFVTFSYMDVAPDKLLFKDMKMRLKKSFIHLQNGFLGIQKIREKGNNYNNNLFKLISYNKKMNEILQQENDFKSYQLKYMKYPPKYGDLVRYDFENNQVLLFLSNREYFTKDPLHKKYFSLIIKRIVEDKDVINYLKSNNLIFKICVHAFIDDVVFNEFYKLNNDLIKIVKQSEVNMQKEIVNSKLIITDYSSYIYDASFINKPYLIFQPDLNNFIMENNFFYGEELNEFIIRKPIDLIDRIITENYNKIDYIEEAMPNEKNFNYINENHHLDDFYNYFKELQDNKITFLGYNFYGIGGTVNATMALAEGLLQSGYLVETISLKRHSKFRHVPPYGLNMKYISWDHSGSIIEIIKRHRYKSSKHYSHLNQDYVKKFLPPFVGHELNNLMKNIRTNTLVSTRETLHLFLNECTSENVKNKVFFFHTHADFVEDIFPGLIKRLNDITIKKAIFITEQNRLALQENLDFNNYESYINLGNTLIQSKIIEKDEITSIEKKEKYSAIYLLRISQGREKDLNNLIEFAKYIKKNNIKFIEIDVFGDGDYVEQFIKSIESNELSDIIHYKFSTETPIEEIKNHDFMIDFSLNHSFGMIYIEAILNGKKVFCMKNPGSIEIMENIPNSYITSSEWLVDQIKNIDKITVNELKDNYEKVSQKYSQKAIATKFLDFINEDD